MCVMISLFKETAYSIDDGTRELALNIPKFVGKYESPYHLPVVD